MPLTLAAVYRRTTRSLRSRSRPTSPHCAATCGQARPQENGKQNMIQRQGAGSARPRLSELLLISIQYPGGRPGTWRPGVPGRGSIHISSLSPSLPHRHRPPWIPNPGPLPAALGPRGRQAASRHAHSTVTDICPACPAATYSRSRVRYGPGFNSALQREYSTSEKSSLHRGPPGNIWR